MAETATGWLIDAEAGGTPERRAFHLLGSFLDDDQKAEAESLGGFTHQEGERLYWIPIEGVPRCAFLDEGRIEHYCIAPSRYDVMPRGDVALTFLLWIKSDPAGFHAEANVMRREPLEVDGGRAEIVAALAGPKPKPARRRPRRRAAVNLPGVSRASAPRDHLDAAGIKEFLERNGRTLPEPLLRKLMTTR